jgi:hypothetical protein
VGVPVVQVVAKAAQQAEAALEPVPARDLCHDLRARRQRLLLLDRGRPVDAPRGAVAPREGRRRIAGPWAEADLAEDRLHRSRRERLVLGREGVERRRPDEAARAVQSIPEVRLAREDAGIGPADVRQQEIPGAPDDVIGLVDADVAAPDDPVAGFLHRRDQGGGLRVVEVDDVARPRTGHDAARARRERLLVEAPLALAERPAVAGVAVQVVVEALRDEEELAVLAQDRPARVDADAADVGQQSAQHLRDPAPARGRVDVPDRPSLEEQARPLGEALHLGVLVADQRLEALERLRRDLDQLRARHAPSSVCATRIAATGRTRARRPYQLPMRPGEDPL